MSDSDDDRRIAPRTPIELKVEYRRLNTFFSDYTKNISRGGTFIATSKPLPVGTEFIFALGIPTMAAPLRLRGKVMWAVSEAEATDDSPAGMGIEFVYSSAEERRTKEHAVEQLLASQFGEDLANRLLRR